MPRRPRWESHFPPRSHGESRSWFWLRVRIDVDHRVGHAFLHAALLMIHRLVFDRHRLFVVHNHQGHKCLPMIKDGRCLRLFSWHSKRQACRSYMMIIIVTECALSKDERFILGWHGLQHKEMVFLRRPPISWRGFVIWPTCWRTVFCSWPMYSRLARFLAWRNAWSSVTIDQNNEQSTEYIYRWQFRNRSWSQNLHLLFWLCLKLIDKWQPIELGIKIMCSNWLVDKRSIQISENCSHAKAHRLHSVHSALPEVWHEWILYLRKGRLLD